MQNFKQIYKQLFLKKEDLAYIKCRYKIINRRIFIKL